MKRLFAALLLTACATRPDIKPPSSFLDAGARPKVMFLGTFHFADAGLDGYKPQHDVNIMEPSRQREVEELVDHLARFAPTKIAVEVQAASEEKINGRYREYLAGSWQLTSNEIYQIGFRLAKKLGHSRVYAIDVKGRDYYTADEWKAKKAELNGDRLSAGPWADRFKAMYEYEDQLKTKVTLSEFLRYLNSPERIRVGHGSYLTGLFHAGRGDDYFGPDNLSGWWYDRNLRIFENIQRTIDSRDDRVLVLIGAGHLPILVHAAQSSPEIEWIDVRRYLNEAR